MGTRTHHERLEAAAGTRAPLQSLHAILAATAENVPHEERLAKIATLAAEALTRAGVAAEIERSNERCMRCNGRFAYQGHASYGTWALDLLLSNDQSTHSKLLAMAGAAAAAGQDKYAFADQLKAHVEALLATMERAMQTGVRLTFPKERAGSSGLPMLLYGQMMQSAIEDVVWDDLADSYLNSAAEGAS